MTTGNEPAVEAGDRRRRPGWLALLIGAALFTAIGLAATVLLWIVLAAVGLLAEVDAWLLDAVTVIPLTVAALVVLVGDRR